MDILFKWFPKGKEMKIKTVQDLPENLPVPNCNIDFWGNNRSSEDVLPGSWNTRTSRNNTLILEKVDNENH